MTDALLDFLKQQRAQVVRDEDVASLPTSSLARLASQQPDPTYTRDIAALGARIFQRR